MPTRPIIGTRVDATSYQHATAEILRWGMLGESRYVCVANVNNLIEAYDDPAYHEVMNGADLVTPDGMPLVWALRLLGVAGATRVYGPDLTPMSANARPGSARTRTSGWRRASTDRVPNSSSSAWERRSKSS